MVILLKQHVDTGKVLLNYTSPFMIFAVLDVLLSVIGCFDVMVNCNWN